MLILKKATEDDMKTIWEMQVRAFSDLLEKYQDYEMSPAAEGFEKVMARYRQPWTTYYFILVQDEAVGAIRIIDKKDGSRTNPWVFSLVPGNNPAGSRESSSVRKNGLPPDRADRQDQ